MNLILFSGRHSLNDQQIRQNLIRVPEVLIEIKYAQKILDEEGSTLDLLEQMSLPSEDFCRRLAVRACLTLLAQVGLYRRWKSNNPKESTQLIFRTGYASPEILLEGLRPRAYRKWLREIFSQDNVYTLSDDISNLKFEDYICRDGKETLFQAESLDEILTLASRSEQGVQVLSLVPGQCFFSAGLQAQFEKQSISVADLFQVDPKLDWFWSEMAPIQSFRI